MAATTEKERTAACDTLFLYAASQSQFEGLTACQNLLALHTKVGYEKNMCKSQNFCSQTTVPCRHYS